MFRNSDVKTDIIVNFEKCVGCRDCANDVFCPSKVFEMRKVDGKRVAFPIRPQECIHCKLCLIYCPTNAIDIKGSLGEIEGVEGLYEAPMSETLKYWFETKYKR